MRFSTGWVAMPLLLAVTACGGGDAGETELSTTDLDTTSLPSQEPGLGPGSGVGVNEVGSGQTSTMTALQNSGVGGDATITDRGEQTEILVRLTGTAPNGTHPGHVHAGTCAAIGSVVQPLEPITTDTTGTGTMTTTISIAPMAVMDGQHIVVYHGAGGSPVACAEIPTHIM
jgi:hypothetical protein